MPDGQLTQMAFSNYLVVLIAIIVIYPFALVAVQILFYADAKIKYTRYLNLLILAVFLFSLFMHLQTEVIYGRELIEWIQSQPKTQ